jgi:hypothetical protein
MFDIKFIDLRETTVDVEPSVEIPSELCFRKVP